MLRAALGGIGLVSTFESIVRERLRERGLVRVLDAFCPPFPGLLLYYPSRANVAPKLKVLIDFLKKRARVR